MHCSVRRATVLIDARVWQNRWAVGAITTRFMLAMKLAHKYSLRESAMAQERQSIHLQDFRESELLFDETEAREVLLFFFPADRTQIYTVSMTNSLRAFAQGLLVAAIDASYAMGWVEIVFKSTANPAKGVKSAIKKIARKGARHWFKHRKSEQTLGDVKIYESVRAQLSRSFRSSFQLMLLAKTEYRSRSFVALINCAPPRQAEMAWS